MHLNEELKSGEYVQLLPAGLYLTLQYNERGVLESVFENFDAKKQLKSSFMDLLVKNETVPGKINTSGGITWVKGVLYTSMYICYEGSIPYCAFEELRYKYIDNPSNFNFFGFMVESMATPVKGSATVRTWLQMNKFHVTNGFIVPSPLTSENFDYIVQNNCVFQYPLISGYVVTSKEDTKVIDNGLHGREVSKVDRIYADRNGYIHAKLYFKYGDPSIVNYSDMIKYNIHPKSFLVYDSLDTIIYSLLLEAKPKRKNSVKCRTCGRVIDVDENYPESAICSDRHCLSRIYPDIVHMLHTLNLPTITGYQYDEYIDKGEITGISDIFILNQYKDMMIETTLPILINAVVPVDAVPNRGVFTIFSEKCNNSLQSFRYYINHPDQFEQDSHTTDSSMTKFLNWLRDPYNSLTLETIIGSDNVVISKRNNAFRFDPILRGQTIYLTGQFLHGKVEEVGEILKGYSANIVYNLDDTVTSAVIGGKHEDVNSVAIRKCKDRSIPIYEESTFFSYFDIDNDLKENLY